MLSHLRTSVRVMVACVALSLAHGGPGALFGQGRGERPVFIAIPENFPAENADLAVIREPGRDIVLLREGTADPRSLAVGLRLLRRLAADDPGPPEGRGQLIPVTGFSGGGALPPALEDRLRDELDRLRGRPVSNVGNLGLGRWMRYAPLDD